MNYTVSDFITDIKECLDLAKFELEARRKGVLGESTLDQLENYIIPDLSKLHDRMVRNELLPENTQQFRYVESFAYAFKVWGWDMGSPTELYLKLLNLNESYSKI